jgi:hypothetical protein
MDDHFLISLVLPLALIAIMSEIDLFFLPIIWDELEDFDGEDQELAGDFFFEVESDKGKLV